MIHKILNMLENKIINLDEAKQLLEIVKIDHNIMNISYNSKGGAYLNLIIPKEMVSKLIDKTEEKVKNNLEDTLKSEDVLKKIFSLVK